MSVVIHRFSLRLHAVAVALALLVAASSPPAHAEGFTLGQALNLPEWLSLSVEHRTRYEYLGDQFRAGGFETNEGAWVFRTLVHGEATLTDWLKIGAELQDSRQHHIGSGSPINTGIVNTMELLRAYFEVRGDAPWGGTQKLQGGRITMDIGDRRFVARNRFRNTINAFTGLDWTWESGEGRELRAFWTLPVNRRPRAAQRLRDNKIEFDNEKFDFQFWGVYYADNFPWFDGKIRHELFYFGLYENDTKKQPTRDRRLHTPGFRIFRQPEVSAFDFQVETALQFGSSKLNTGSSRDLDVFAQFHHAEVGYSFDCVWKPRLLFQFDYASGDRTPNDGNNERFDTLFGARRFDFGPTGIYGPFVRANLISPGVRLIAKPLPNIAGFIAFRGYWLAQKKDAWVAAGVVDPTGDSGRFIGQQIEFRLQWDVVPDNVKFETGYAHLFAGKFPDDAPNSNQRNDSDYLYTQVTVKF